MNVLDTLAHALLDSANTAIFDVGAVMAILMLLFGLLDWFFGKKLRQVIRKRKLDRPELATAFALIPVDGTLLFQYETYRRGSLRFGTLFAGIIGIGEESTYMVLSYNPLYWLILAVVKLLIGTIGGRILNMRRFAPHFAKLKEMDESSPADDKAREADENFHELPDKYRHRFHRFRYHALGMAFWFFFGTLFAVSILIHAADRFLGLPEDAIQALGIPLVHWFALLCLILTAFYAVIVHLATREFGKIFPDEFEDAGDAVGDLAEMCARIVLLIFVVSFLVQAATNLIGMELISKFFSGRGLLAVAVGALIGLIPGTGATLAFTAVFFTLQGTPGALPLAALMSSSIALIGDSQFVGSQTIRHSQRHAHLYAFIAALVSGVVFYLLFPGL